MTTSSLTNPQSDLRGFSVLLRFAVWPGLLTTRSFSSVSIMQVAMTRVIDGLMEIIVMSLVVARLSVALASHGLFYELSMLLLVSLVALFVEFYVFQLNGHRFFKPRVGTSAGIFTGVLCIPCVLSARMVEYKRISKAMPSLNDFEGFTSDFWSAITSSMGLLVYIWKILEPYTSCSTIIERKSPKMALKSRTFWATLFLSMLFTAFSFPVKIMNAAFLITLSTWLLEYGVNTFPGCASLGEAILLSNGLSVIGSNVIARVVAKYGISSSAVSHAAISNKEVILGILQGIVIVFPCLPWMYKAFSFLATKMLACFQVQPTKRIEKICHTISFFLSLCVVSVMTLGWIDLISGTTENLMKWVINFIFQDRQRVYLCLYWTFVISTTVIPFYMEKNTILDTIMVRKIFHLMVVVMFVPALFSQQEFLGLAFSVAFVAFLVVEMVRVLQIPPFGGSIHRFMVAFTDSRDSGILIISHFSLLLGCALPVWLANPLGDRPLAPFAGIFSLGIGDTMASVVGYNLGSLQLSRTNKKTLEGTTAGILSVFLACLIILELIHAEITVGDFFSLIIAVHCTGLMEAFTSQLDNAFLPLIFYSLLIA